MNAVSNRVRILAVALVATLAMALVPAVSASAAGPGSMTLTITSATPLSPFTFVFVQGPEGQSIASFDGSVATATDLALGEYTATVPGSSSGPASSIAFTLTASAPAFVGELVLQQWPTGTATLSGTIVDDSGNPIEGADVSLFSGERPFPQATTGPDGTYAYTDLPAGEYTVGAFRDGYFSRTTSVTIADGTAVVADLTLPARNATIAGRLVDGSGNPVSVSVSAVRADSSDGTGTFANPDGTFLLTGLGAGDWVVSAGGPGTPWAITSRAVTLTGGENASIADIVLTARTTGNIFGFVSDTSTPFPQPIADICAALLKANGTQLAVVTTGNDGSLAFFDVAPGTYTVKYTDCSATRSPKFATAYFGGGTTLATATKFTVAAGQDVYADATLKPVQATPQPSHPAKAVKATELRLSTLGKIHAPLTVTQAQGFTVKVGTAYAGKWVSVWLRTPNSQLGGWVRVASNGTVQVTVPTHYQVGAHALVVQDDRDKVIGWTAVLVRPRR